MGIKYNVPMMPKGAIPQAAGFYVAFFSLSPQLINIKEVNGELMNLNGAVTHFSRWDVRWSVQLDFADGNTGGITASMA